MSRFIVWWRRIMYKTEVLLHTSSILFGICLCTYAMCYRISTSPHSRRTRVPGRTVHDSRSYASFMRCRVSILIGCPACAAIGAQVPRCHRTDPHTPIQHVLPANQMMCFRRLLCDLIGFRYEEAFKGSDLVDWLIHHDLAHDRSTALNLGR